MADCARSGPVAVAATLALVLSTDRLLWVLEAVSRRCRFWIQEQIPRRAEAIPDIDDCACTSTARFRFLAVHSGVRVASNVSGTSVLRQKRNPS